MKVLLVTRQVLQKKEGKVYCEFALSSTLKHFQELGELYICAVEYTGVSSQPLDTLTDIPIDHLLFLNNENSLKYRYLDRTYNKQVLEDVISKVDLVIGYIPATIGDLALKIAHRKGKKYMSFVVACVWDSQWNHRNWKARVMAPLQFLETKCTIRNSDYVWYVTERFLQERYPTKGRALGCTDTNINDSDDEILTKRLLHIKAHQGRVRLLTVGHLDVGFKGQQFVISAMPLLIRQGADVEYYMIGDGQGNHLKALGKSLGVEDRLFFTGKKTRSEVLALMDEADIYVQPSLQEGLPRSVAEAMSRAMPVVGSRTGGIPEMIDDAFIAERKSVADLVRIIAGFGKEEMEIEAVRNFNKAKDYQPKEIHRRLSEFFSSIQQNK